MCITVAETGPNFDNFLHWYWKEQLFLRTRPVTTVKSTYHKITVTVRSRDQLLPFGTISTPKSSHRAVRISSLSMRVKRTPTAPPKDFIRFQHWKFHDQTDHVFHLTNRHRFADINQYSRGLSLPASPIWSNMYSCWYSFMYWVERPSSRNRLYTRLMSSISTSAPWAVSKRSDPHGMPITTATQKPHYAYTTTFFLLATMRTHIICLLQPHTKPHDADCNHTKPQQ